MNNWTLFEKVWLAVFTAIQIILFFWWQQTWIDFVCAISNMLCVVLVAKGRLSNFFFGMIATSFYAYISYNQKYNGEVMLSAFFYFPMQFIGLYFWLKKQNKVHEVQTRKLSKKGWLLTTFLIAICCFGYAKYLTYLKSQQAHLDSLTVVICIAAQILMTLRYTEQWLLWILSNVLGLFIWGIAGNHAMLMMTCASLFNSLYGYYHWNKSARNIS